MPKENSPGEVAGSKRIQAKSNISSNIRPISMNNAEESHDLKGKCCSCQIDDGKYGILVSLQNEGNTFC